MHTLRYTFAEAVAGRAVRPRARAARSLLAQRIFESILCLGMLSIHAPGAAAGESDPASLPAGLPVARVDLRTHEGTELMKAAWKYHDASVIEIDFHAVGADGKPTGPANRTYDIEPHAGGADYDDRAWITLDPTSLEERRSGGKVCFNWYRIRLTVPQEVHGTRVAGTTLVFQTTVDDYAEVWVDGELPRRLGQQGESLVAGWNAPNRLVLGTAVQPGEQIQLAVFGINGPISDAPSNYIWIRDASLEFLAPPGEASRGAARLAQVDPQFRIDRVHPELDAVLPPGSVVEKLADGFGFAEGPAWSPDGALYFSDPNTNVIYRYRDGQHVEVFRTQSGYEGTDLHRYRQPGSNGLAFDPEGRLTVCQHGNRRVVRLDPDGSETVLADRYEGRRLNSPNDLIYRSDGSLYFTDPYFGLPGLEADSAKELPFSGVYMYKNGVLHLLVNDLLGPNGLAFSPDEQFLYVANWDPEKKWLMRYPVRDDGTLRAGTLFFDMTGAPGEEALDGVKVDAAGHVFVSGPGGVWVLSSAGQHLGTFSPEQLPANFAWGDRDGRTLYLTARTGLYRVRVQIPGASRRIDDAARAAR